MADRSRQLALQGQEASTSQQAPQELDQEHEKKLNKYQIHPEALQNGVASNDVIDDAKLKDDDADY